MTQLLCVKILDSHTANQIAAGEVIERPASVVKELVENSIDAKSSKISIEIEEGGLSLLKISDNGIGMHREDAKTAFLRHATSKISNAEDLHAISTLGFRGEALPSIAAVARVELTTCQAGQIAGTQLIIEGGQFIAETEAASSIGTIIGVKDLFYNTPARKKFLKSETTEIGHISDIITRLAMAHPEIAFTLTIDGRQAFSTPGSGDLQATLVSIYGRENARQMVPVEYLSEILKVTGYISKTTFTRTNRSHQSIFLNGRYIRSRLVSDALTEAYHTLLAGQRYPVAVLNLTIDPSQVDVNVHPTKMEVRFSREREIRQAVAVGVRQALMAQRLIPGWEVQENKGTYLVSNQKSQPSLLKFKNKEVPDKVLYKESKSASQSNLTEPYAPSNLPQTVQGPQNEEFLQEVLKLENKRIDTTKTDFTPRNESMPKLDSSGQAEEFFIEEQVQGKNTTDNEKFLEELPETKTAPASQTSVLEQRGTEFSAQPEPLVPPLTPMGQIDRTYILAEGEQGLYILDQHAIHERLLYEEYMKASAQSKVLIQDLLIPITLSLTGRDNAVLVQNIVTITDLGFIVEHFGGQDFLLRGVPVYLKEDPQQFFLDLLDDLASHDKNLTTVELKEAMLTMMACKAAIKANQSLTIKEMTDLIDKWRYTDNPFTCPHGRPTVIHMSVAELEKKFKRS